MTALSSSKSSTVSILSKNRNRRGYFCRLRTLESAFGSPILDVVACPVVATLGSLSILPVSTSRRSGTVCCPVARGAGALLQACIIGVIGEANPPEFCMRIACGNTESVDDAMTARAGLIYLQSSSNKGLPIKNQNISCKQAVTLYIGMVFEQCISCHSNCHHAC